MNTRAKILPFPPLRINKDHWRSRWLVTRRWTVLHRVSAIEWQDGEMIEGPGVTVCGHHAHLRMPGIFSRMGLPRCKVCCRRLGIPAGDGAPYNNLKGKAANR